MKIAFGFICGWITHRFIAWLEGEATKCLADHKLPPHHGGRGTSPLS